MTNPYLLPARVRASLQSLGLRPTRSMGQNFLIDPGALAAIVGAGDLHADDTVLEIGPGLGVLTWELVQRAGRVVAVELDRRLEARLHEEFASQPNLELVQGDVLRHDPGTLLQQDEQVRPYKLVANLPYAITSAVLRHVLEAAHPPTLIVVLVQWEVAQRIVARPGDLSVLAHSVQVYAEPDIVARVPAASFLPPPEVDSAVLRLRMRPHPAVPRDSVDPLMRVIKAGFLHSRKKLANALPGGLAAMGAPIEKAAAIAVLEAAGVDPQRRAETLTLEEWAAVYRALQARKS